MEAAHIVPVAHFTNKVNEWRTAYLPYCFDQSNGGYDIRNGLLLCPNHHKMFDQWKVTIVCHEDRYWDGAVDPVLNTVIRGYNELLFGNDPSWRPHAKFLEYHNTMYDFFDFIDCY